MPGDYRGQLLAVIVYASSFAFCVASGVSYASERVPRFRAKSNRNFRKFVALAGSGVRCRSRAVTVVKA
jgi:hypothetical protein